MKPSLVCGLAVLAAASGCARKATPGGLLVKVSTEGTFDAALTRLHFEIGSAGEAGAAIGRDYAIPGGAGFFPATLGLQSNGDPAASVTIDVSLWSGARPLDDRRYEVLDVPTSSVEEVDVVFSPNCTALVVVGPGPTALSSCGPSGTCDPRSGTCASDRYGAAGDGGDLDADFATDSTVEAGADHDGTVTGDATLEGGPMSDAAPLPPGYDGGVPCSPACVEGQSHCVGGKCVAVPPSCRGGGLGAGFNCGAEGFGTLDCCSTLDVPLDAQDDFYRDDYPANPVQSYPATVSQFGLDELEVTVGRFRKFVGAVVGADGGLPWMPESTWGKHEHLSGGQGLNAGGSTPKAYENGWDSSWDSALPTTKSGWDARLSQACQYSDLPGAPTWTPEAASREQLPINCIDWFAAYAFCIWDGGFLPSTTEWEFAAAGGRRQRTFAWGEQVPGANCNLAVWDCLYGGSAACQGPSNIAPVGSAPDGRGWWGQLDLTGNVFEWTLDFYSDSYVTPCVDCADFETAGERICRGGGWGSDAVDQLYNSLQTPASGSARPTTHRDPAGLYPDVGVRCARRPY